MSISKSSSRRWSRSKFSIWKKLYWWSWQGSTKQGSVFEFSLPEQGCCASDSGHFIFACNLGDLPSVSSPINTAERFFFNLCFLPWTNMKLFYFIRALAFFVNCLVGCLFMPAIKIIEHWWTKDTDARHHVRNMARWNGNHTLDREISSKTKSQTVVLVLF